MVSALSGFPGGTLDRMVKESKCGNENKLEKVMSAVVYVQTSNPGQNNKEQIEVNSLALWVALLKWVLGLHAVLAGGGYYLAESMW